MTNKADTSGATPLQIDIDQVLAGKLGKNMKFVPKPLVAWLKRTVRQDEINRLLRLFHPKTGADFCEAAISELNVDVTVANPEALPAPEDRRVIFACNHPLGGFDGVALIALLSRRYGPNVRFVVNDLLMHVEPLANVFLPINKHGRQSREAIDAINQAMEGPEPIVVFPAGLVSRQGKDGTIRDLEWHKMFAAKAVQHHRDVVPVHFSGRLSDHFYRVARRRKRWGLKFNIEMLYLPAETLDTRDHSFSITVGQRIPWQQIQQWGDSTAAAQRVKEKVYEME
ncbi:MAG: 1-acyl-sn-glycerol-3-phosphate acyltransferase [Bacteroidales bacterium]|nr:1-acyl-sn-glycerol-3-phosphate acyltransferase [Bacteroidales bacterium]